MKYVSLFVVVAVCLGQQATAPETPQSSTLEPLAPRPDGKARIFVGESSMFFASSFSGSGVAASAGKAVGSGFGVSSASVMKFTITVMKSINDTCPDKAVIVRSPDLADYFLRMDLEGVWRVRSNMVAFNRSGEMSFVASEKNISKDVKGFCASLPATASTPANPIKKGKK